MMAHIAKVSNPYGPQGQYGPTQPYGEVSPLPPQNTAPSLINDSYVPGELAVTSWQPQMSPFPLRNATNSPPPGTLFVNDDYRRESMEKLSHGDLVEKAARNQGFQGPIVAKPTYNIGPQAQSAQMAGQMLLNSSLTPELARLSVATYVQSNAISALDSQSQSLDEITWSGAKNTVVNLSQGISVASATEQLYFGLTKGWKACSDPVEQQQTSAVIANYASAYGLDAGKLQSSDPDISGPERARLQQSLVKQVVTDLESPGVAQAKAGYEAAVERFEAGNNSLVVAAGNFGQVKLDLESHAGGHRLRNTPKNFTTNIYATPVATVVGATEGHKKVADYSTQGPEVDIHALGDLGHGGETIQGTSFAAPRVAAEMAKLHAENPTLGSHEIESLLHKGLTHQVNSNTGTISILDFG